MDPARRTSSDGQQRQSEPSQEDSPSAGDTVNIRPVPSEGRVGKTGGVLLMPVPLPRSNARTGPSLQQGGGGENGNQEACSRAGLSSDRSPGAQQGVGREVGRDVVLDRRTKESGLWAELETVMSAKRNDVLSVLEEFGVDVSAPTIDSPEPLEDTMWRVVQGELTLQEAADLV